MTVHIGQAEVATRVTKRESLVIQPEQVQNGGVKIVHVDRVFFNLIADVIGLSVNHSALHAAAGEP